MTDEALGQQIFAGMKAEYNLACDLVCRVMGQSELLQSSPVMQRSIERRNPYVDPLNFIQVDLLRKLRAMTGDSPDFRMTMRNVLATVNGISAGMKVTG